MGYFYPSEGIKVCNNFKDWALLSERALIIARHILIYDQIRSDPRYVGRNLACIGVFSKIDRNSIPAPFGKITANMRRY